jgi:hypothetical protein
MPDNHIRGWNAFHAVALVRRSRALRGKTWSGLPDRSASIW